MAFAPSKTAGCKTSSGFTRAETSVPIDTIRQPSGRFFRSR
jgi:hypothetical protein